MKLWKLPTDKGILKNEPDRRTGVVSSALVKMTHGRNDAADNFSKIYVRRDMISEASRNP